MNKHWLFSLLLASSTLWAHPHAFVEMQTQALVENQQIIGFKMDWTLDDISSGALIYELQTSEDKAAKTRSLTNEMIESAKEAHYFSYFYNQKNDLIKFNDKPSDYGFVVKDHRIIFSMKFYLEQPQSVGKLPVTLMTYEPTYYMAMEYENEKALSVNKPYCKIHLKQPTVDESLRLYASSLDKDQTPEDVSLGRHFAQKVSVVCD